MKYQLLIISLLAVILTTAGWATSAWPGRNCAAQEPLHLTTDQLMQLVNECGLRTTQMTSRLYAYTFNETDTEVVLDKQGNVQSEESKVFEVYPISAGNRRRWIYVQVSENGSPLSPERIARERERAAKQTMELEREAAGGQTNQVNASYRPRFSSYGIRVEKHGNMSRTIWFINPTDFLVSHDFFGAQRVKFGGRETVLLSFKPRPGYVYDQTNVPYPSGIEDYGRVMSQLGGRIWIDADDKVIARLEAVPAQELGDPNSPPKTSPDEKAPVWFELMRLPNGTWAPKASRYNSYGRESVFWKTPISRSRSYSDYKLFKTTVEFEKTDSQSKP